MSDEELLERFKATTLTRDQWTHRNHVRVAYLHLDRHALPEAIAAVCAGIQKLNAALGVEEGPMSGYNETTTVAFMRIIAAVKGAYAKTHAVADAEGFCAMHPELMSPYILRMFYSPGRRMDPKAKTQFVEPDLTRLPVVLVAE